MEWQAPLVVSAVLFAAVLVYRMRPVVSGVVSPEGRAARAALKDAQARVATAKNDAERARALSDAGDAAARLGAQAAVGFYLRALRADPRSPEVVERAVAGLARRPAALENLLWRHLAAASWSDDARDAAITSLRALAAVYAKKKRTEPRARAIDNVLAALTSRADPRAGAE